MPGSTKQQSPKSEEVYDSSVNNLQKNKMLNVSVAAAVFHIQMRNTEYKRI
jgi:hypothetical protein